jgi:hypothetical protein
MFLNSVSDQVIPPAAESIKPKRHRTISENNKFMVTPVRTFPKKSSGIPRNSTAPNFVDQSLILPRISSTPGFGRLAVLHGGANNEDQE